VAACFFHLDCHSFDKFQPKQESNDLIESGLDGKLLKDFTEPGTKFSAPKLVLDLKNDEGELHGMAHYLMHRIIDHVAIVNGLELPQFSVDHALVGAFFSVAEDDFPLAELEWHSIPLHGIRILEVREVHPLNHSTTVTDQVIINAVAHHPCERSHGDFMEIWKMKWAEEVKHPSCWIIKYPLEPVNQDCLLSAVYDALFGSGLQDVDSAMVGALAGILGPATITLCDAVPLPPTFPSVPSDSPSPTDANPPLSPRSLDDFDCVMLQDYSEEEEDLLDFSVPITFGHMDLKKVKKD
jgi:hypothetical protein